MYFNTGFGSYEKVLASTLFLFTTLLSIAQTASKPISTQHASSSQIMQDATIPHELKKNAASVSVRKNTVDSLQQLNPPKLKRKEYSSGKK